MRRRWLVAIVLGSVALLGGVYWALTPDKPQSDELRVRALLEHSLAMYNADDWEGLAKVSWNEQGEAATREWLAGQVSTPRVEEPLTLHALRVDGERAVAEVTLKWKFLTMRGERRARVEFVKRDGQWLLDFVATRKNAQP